MCFETGHNHRLGFKTIKMSSLRLTYCVTLLKWFDFYLSSGSACVPLTMSYSTSASHPEGPSLYFSLQVRR